ncbi:MULTISPECIES: RagB/SusD family nutrient uptake outer membrane protein [Chryseobacterium]|uniref:RagB/SusD family nutrient uptake outer membrane protein n=1 Tax=Chryseobacterium nepalense TaxID=1854498 RepID=A0ABY4K7Z3_9FLAO|nr:MULTISPECIES: RagB/SusD family nutrient uptake outer membrane protein [Chryseobacterium]MEA1851142.1 RagB/SusD family nutrient uptake outer membrane protein [Chryseobacterium sp. MHB01]UPQ76899.1 RagB/SusD family nutrient uptake outer membrane protein [Chryseobacterium nepalense]
MNKKIIILSVIALSGLFLNSCNDELDVTPTASVSTQDLSLYNNDEGAKSFVTAVYAKFLDWDMSTFSWIGITSIITDDADKGSSPGDSGSDKDLIDALNITPTTGSFNEVWRANYKGINRANQALKFIPMLDQANPQLRNRLIGEVKFLRAFMYFTLVKGWGGVPIVDRIADSNNEEDRKMLLTRKSKEEVYAFIVKDLEDAIAALPAKSAYSGADVGRASKGAAYALLAKVYLYQKNWQKVSENCDQVVGYSLTPNFQDIYKVSGENNAESIFEIQGFGGASMPGIQQYSQVQGARGAGGWGWGFNTPSQSLVDAFNAAGDTERRDATIIFRNSTLYDGRVVPATVENPYYNYKAYSSAFTGSDDSDANIRYLRYSEVLLMKAEALNETGQTNNAATYLNQVRSRAGLANTTATTQAAMRTAIWNERRLELAFEHDRWFDLVRTGQAQAAMAANGKTFVVGRHELFPIPQSFIDESKGMSQQNPGY